ncbi:MAG: domain S-box [Planctomycetaceae bacterium]|nr:domain S-box [Planctomycetaceae bacterium]
MNETRRTPLVAYSIAVLGPAVSLLIRWPLWTVLEDRLPHMTFFPAVALAAYYGGLRSGLLATVLSSLAAGYFLLTTQSSLPLSYTHVAVGFCLFVLVGAMLSILSESLHRTQRRLLTHERQRAEKTLQEAEERFRQMAENIHEIFWLFDTQEDRITYVSPGYEAVWGRTCQSLYEQPRSLNESVYSDDRDRAIECIEQYRHGVFSELEFRIVRPDGSIRWIRSRAFPVDKQVGNDNQIGNIRRFAGLAEDITERKWAETALRESEQRFQTFVNHATDAFFLQDERYMVLDVNRQACESLGYTREELLGMVPTDFDPDVTPFNIEEISRQLDDGEIMAFESRHRRKDGTVFPVEVRGQSFWEGGRRFTVALVRDITERKRSDEALRASEHRWRSLTEALPQLVWTATPDGACDYFSTQWTHHTGVAENELLGWRWLETLHAEDRERTRQAWTAAVEGPDTYDVEYRVRHTDGEYRWFKTRGVPIRDGAGNIFKWFGTCTDITDGKTTAEELRVAKEAAESANRAKDEFLANVSHEIRTPMNAILGMTELVLDTSLAEDQRQSLKTVKAAADNLLNIINDLLDFSKIESGKLELDLADFSLRSVLGETLRTLAMRAHRKGLELISDVHPGVPDALVGDSGRLRQILLNLIGNALKFTEQGDVVVRVECTDEPTLDDEVRLLFSVTDTGIGIPPDKHEAIFRAFEQEDTSTTRKYGGTGLGLTIASRLVALMGGKISVVSQPGRGSTFTFTASCRRQTQSSETISAQPPVLLQDLPVLIVDDNETNRYILEEWLHGWKMKPTAVGDGVAAMDALWQSATTERQFALILLDARMPDTDGLALAARIRERTSRSATRIVLLTSGDRNDDAARSHQLGIDARLLKPVRQDELLETIYQVMSQTHADAPAVGGPVPFRPPMQAPDQISTSLRILVAEDNEFNAQLLEQLLSRRGHRVGVAFNGREALHLAQEERFDLLFLDIHMPELDGFQVIQRIRERERAVNEHLPVIALTARSRKEDRDKCLAAGMDDFLSKPIQAAALWAAIDRVMNANAAVPVASTSPFAEQKSGLLDVQVLLAACGGDDAILRNICTVFRDRLPGHLQAAKDSLRSRNMPLLREAAHKLCGMLAAFSSVAGAIASDLEDSAAGGCHEACQPLMEQLDVIASELIQQVDGLSIDTLRSQAMTAASP